MTNSRAAEEDSGKPKTYLSADLLGIPFGRYQLALEIPVSHSTSLIAKGQYLDIKYGTVYSWAWDLSEFLNTFSEGDNPPIDYSTIKNHSMFSVAGGAFGISKYLSKKPFIPTYFGGTISYVFYKYRSISEALLDSTAKSSCMPIHSGTMAGRLGAKFHLDDHISFDTFLMVSLSGIYFDMQDFSKNASWDSDFLSLLDIFSLQINSLYFIPGCIVGFRIA